MNVDKIAEALAKAQAVMVNPKLNKDGVYAKYASLEAIIDAVKKPLSDNGISFVQLPETFFENGKALVSIRTFLMHDSGQFIENKLTMIPEHQSVHKVASAITYARRYSLQSICGVVGDEDDDGEAAQGLEKKNKDRKNKNEKKIDTPEAPSAINPLSKKIEKDDIDKLRKLSSEKDCRDEVLAFCKEKFNKQPQELVKAEYLKLLNYIHNIGKDNA